MTFLRAFGLTACVLLCMALSASAQSQQGRVQLTATAGVLLSDDASALNDPLIIGVEAIYNVTPIIAFGVSGNFARAKSDGSFFPAMQWDVGEDTTRLFHVGQDLSILTYTGVMKVGLPSGRATPYVIAGAGGWVFLLDPQSNDAPSRSSSFLWEIGGGVHLRLGDVAGLRVDLRDLVFAGYKRDDLNPVAERFRSDVFLAPQPPAFKTPIHNIRLTAGITYLVGG